MVITTRWIFVNCYVSSRWVFNCWRRTTSTYSTDFYSPFTVFLPLVLSYSAHIEIRRWQLSDLVGGWCCHPSRSFPHQSWHLSRTGVSVQAHLTVVCSFNIWSCRQLNEIPLWPGVASVYRCSHSLGKYRSWFDLKSSPGYPTCVVAIHLCHR